MEERINAIHQCVFFIVSITALSLIACDDEYAPATSPEPLPQLECTVATDCPDEKYECIDSKCFPTTVPGGESVNRCGSNRVDCTKVEGWKSGSCSAGVCVASSCDTSEFYLSSATGTCLLNDDLNCGQEDSACPPEKKCSSGECSDKCTASEAYCVVDEVGGCYELNTLIHCGACNTPCAPENAAVSSCSDGICQAIECLGGFHLTESLTCEADSLTACGVYAEDCTTLMGWKEGGCVHGECTATQCQADFHLYEGKCERDSASACGDSRVDCTKTEGWREGECLYARCNAHKCAGGYHYDNGLCAEDTVSQCGDLIEDCTQIPGWFSGECLYGRCSADDCRAYYHFSSDGTCEADSVTACGRGYAVVDCT